MNTLRDWSIYKRYTLEDALELFREILKALALLHAEGVTHRDIRPDNILVKPDGHIKIIDFGLSKTEKDSTLTMIRALGNMYYSPPEQLQEAGKHAEPTLDIYSAGQVLYYLICMMFDVEFILYR